MTSVTCPECGLDYRPCDAPKQLCPGCLYQVLAAEAAPELAEELRTRAAAQPRFVPPKINDLQPHFPHVEILELLGQGGMSAVYKARQTSVDRLVALKVLPREIAEAAGGVERFARETRTLAGLNHPNLVTLYDAGQAGPWCYCMMELISGPNLRQLLGDSRLPPADVLRLVPDVCDALQYAHDQGVVHRDIKPENVLIDEHGRARIADFGLVKILSVEPGRDRSVTATQQILGTPRYIAPEQIDHPGKVDHRADLYSLGVMLYEMLTGEVPAGHFQPPSRKSGSDARLDEVVLRALASEPSRRYQNARDLRGDLMSLPLPKADTKRGGANGSPGRQAEWFYSAVSIALAVLGVGLAINSQENPMLLGSISVLLAAISVLLARINVASAQSWRDLSLAQILSTPHLLAGYLVAGSVLLFLPAVLIIGIGGVLQFPGAEEAVLGGDALRPSAPQEDARLSPLRTPFWLRTIGAALLASAGWGLALAIAGWRWPVFGFLFHPSGPSTSRAIVLGLAVLATAVFLPVGCALLILAHAGG